MKNIFLAELHLHNQVIQRPGTDTLNLLIKTFSEHLLKYLYRCYKKHLNDCQIINEAVYHALEWYHEHPMMYVAEHGSLKKFLELRADRNLQEMLRERQQSIHISGVAHVLACYVDNERDYQVAKLLLKNDHDLSSYILFIDTSVLRFNQIKSDVQRLKQRVQNIISQIPNLKPSRRSDNALLVAFNEPVYNPFSYRQVGL